MTILLLTSRSLLPKRRSGDRHGGDPDRHGPGPGPSGVVQRWRLRLRGRGVPKRGGGSGDLHAIVKIVVPKELSDRERELYEQLAESSSPDPREDMTMNADTHTGPADRDLAAEERVELTVVARQAGSRSCTCGATWSSGCEPHPAAAAETPRFEPSSAARVARAERLRQDLGLNYAGAVLVCELLDRISELKARL